MKAILITFLVTSVCIKNLHFDSTLKKATLDCCDDISFSPKEGKTISTPRIKNSKDLYSLYKELGEENVEVYCEVTREI